MNIVVCFVFFSDTNVYSGLNILLVKVLFVLLKQFAVQYSSNYCVIQEDNGDQEDNRSREKQNRH